VCDATGDAMKNERPGYIKNIGPPRKAARVIKRKTESMFNRENP